MKHFSATLAAVFCTLLVAPGTRAAEVPKDPQLTRYADLWLKSPFTTPPKKVEDAPPVNPFEDLALRGIAPLSTGNYLITLVNKKNPTETTIIDTERSAEYEVVKIERHPEEALGTVVHLKKGTISGTVSYDEKLSTLPPPGPKKPQAGQPPQAPGAPPMPPGMTPPVPGAPQPRSRVIPPPTTGGATPGAPGATQPGNRFQPGGTPGSRFQPGGAQSTHTSRPSRH